MSIATDITTDIVSDPVLSLTGDTGATDPDAIAFIAAVKAAGVSVSLLQSLAIDSFFSAGWSRDYGLKQMFFPVWTVADANLIDLVSAASVGSWEGTVTHADGYAKGNGTDGYLETGKAPSTLGIAYTSCMVGVLVATAPTKNGRWFGSQTSSDPLEIFQSSSADVTSYSYDFTNGAIALASPYASAPGIWMISRTDTTTHKLFKRTSSGVTETAGGTSAIGSGSITATQRGMARNNGGAAASEFSDAGFGAFFSGNGMSDANANAFSLALKTMWEAVTGLALP